MVGAALSFAVMIAVLRHVTASLHPFEAAFFRNLVGVAWMLPWFMRAGRGALHTRRFKLHLLRAACGLSAMLCLFSAVSLIPIAEATALTFAAPLFGVAGAALVLGERVRLRRWSATLTGFAGVLIILRPGAGAISTGALAALAAAVFMAGAMLTIKSLSRSERPEAIVLYFGLLVTPLSALPAAFVWTTPPATLWPWLVVMGLAATLGQILLVRAFAAADASVVLPFDFSRLVFVAVLGALFFGEIPDLWTWLGGGVIIAATVYIAHRESRLGVKPPPPVT